MNPPDHPRDGPPHRPADGLAGRPADRTPRRPPDGPADALQAAQGVLAQARAQCVELGLSPRDFGELLLPEALLALMIGGVDEGDCRRVFEAFAEREIPAWYRQAARGAERCDCALENRLENQASASACPAHPLVLRRSTAA